MQAGVFQEALLASCGVLACAVQCVCVRTKAAVKTRDTARASSAKNIWDL